MAQQILPVANERLVSAKGEGSKVNPDDLENQVHGEWLMVSRKKKPQPKKVTKTMINGIKTLVEKSNKFITFS